MAGPYPFPVSVNLRYQTNCHLMSLASAPCPILASILAVPGLAMLRMGAMYSLKLCQVVPLPITTKVELQSMKLAIGTAYCIYLRESPAPRGTKETMSQTLPNNPRRRMVVPPRRIRAQNYPAPMQSTILWTTRLTIVTNNLALVRRSGCGACGLL